MRMSRFVRVAAAAVALAAAALLFSARPATAQDELRLLVIAVDGLRPDYVLQADQHGLRIPNLRRFLREGVHATGVRGVTPTVTYPSFTTILTGASPARHGIVANTTFDPLERNAGGWFWYAQDIRVPTLWDVVASAGLKTASVHWPVSVGARVTWNLPQIWRTGTPDDRKLVTALASAGLVKELEETIGEPYANGIDESIEGDENRARFAVRLLEARRPNVMTAYFTALDHEQHETGPLSRSDFSVLERIDAIIGRLLDAAARMGDGRAFVAVVSDHGFEAIERDVNLRTAFRSAGLLTFAEEGADKPSDWRATVWTNGASAAVILKDPADSRTRADVKALLARLSADPANGIRRVLEGEAISKLGGYPDASFVIDLEPGFQFGNRTTGVLVTQRGRGGMHGYLPDNPNMRASFLLLGPGIRAGASLGEIDMRDVGPTLASLIGLELPGAEGRALPVKR